MKPLGFLNCVLLNFKFYVYMYFIYLKTINQERSFLYEPELCNSNRGRSSTTCRSQIKSLLTSSNSVQRSSFCLTSCQTRCLKICLDFFYQVALGLAFFLFPWGVHPRSTLGILFWGIIKICPSHRRRR